MQSRNTAGFSLILFLVFAAQGITAEKLLVSVYYETLCPHSIRFIKDQVYPVYTELSDAIQLDLVPYGKANTTVLCNGTVLTHSCQHGPNECYGNKVHACAMARLESWTAAAFVNCSMSQPEPPSAGPLCADLLNVSNSRIEECASGQEGEFLLAAHGFRTSSELLSTYGLPLITYNNTLYEQDLDASQQDLLPVVCKHLITKPQYCCKKLA